MAKRDYSTPMRETKKISSKAAQVEPPESQRDTVKECSEDHSKEHNLPEDLNRVKVKNKKSTVAQDKVSQANRSVSHEHQNTN